MPFPIGQPGGARRRRSLGLVQLLRRRSRGAAVLRGDCHRAGRARRIGRRQAEVPPARERGGRDEHCRRPAAAADLRGPGSRSERVRDRTRSGARVDRRDQRAARYRESRRAAGGGGARAEPRAQPRHPVDDGDRRHGGRRGADCRLDQPRPADGRRERRQQPRPEPREGRRRRAGARGLRALAAGRDPGAGHRPGAGDDGVAQAGVSRGRVGRGADAQSAGAGERARRKSTRPRSPPRR